MRTVGSAYVRAHAAHVDDAACAGFENVRQCRLGAHKSTVQNDAGDVFPLGQRQAQKFAVSPDAGVVDQNIEATKGLNGLVDHLAYKNFVTDIAQAHDGAPACSLDFLLHRQGLVAGRARIDDNVRAQLRELQGGRPADAAHCASDKSRLA